MDDLNAASLEEVHEWFNTYYGPNNAVIVIAGDISPEEAYTKVNKYFGDIEPGAPIARFETWTVKLDADKHEIIQDRVPQARLYKVWGAPTFRDEDADLLQLADGVLTSGKTSRLYQRLVYTDQIATDVGSYQFAGDIGGYYQLRATAQPGGDLAACEQAMNEELQRCLKDGTKKGQTARGQPRPVARRLLCELAAHTRPKGRSPR